MLRALGAVVLYVFRLVRDSLVLKLFTAAGFVGLVAVLWDILNAAPRGIGTILGLSAIGLSMSGLILGMPTNEREAERRRRLASASELLRIRFVYDANNVSNVHPMPPQHEFGRGGFLYRVGLKNEDSTAAENVRVRLVSAHPGATGLPAALHWMHDRSQPPQRSSSINGLSTEYVDVVIIPDQMSSRIIEQLDLSLDDPVPHMFVSFADPVFPWIPITDCVLALAVDGNNVQPIEGRFYVSRDDTRYTVRFESEAMASALPAASQ